MGRLSMMLAVGTLAVAGCSSAPTPAPAPTTAAAVGQNWLHKPTGDDIAKVYPRVAANKGIEGRGLMHCKVTSAGTLADCEVRNESPEGLGFAAAFLKLAPLFKMSPTTKDGKSVEGSTVDIPIHFVLRQ